MTDDLIFQQERMGGRSTGSIEVRSRVWQSRLGAWPHIVHPSGLDKCYCINLLNPY